MGGTKEQVPNSQPVTSSRLLCRNNDEAAFLATLVSHITSDTNAESHSFRAVSEFVYVGDVAWTLRVRARPDRHADSQISRYTNPGTALKNVFTAQPTVSTKLFARAP